MKKLILLILSVVIMNSMIAGCENSTITGSSNKPEQSTNSSSLPKPEVSPETVDIHKLESIFGFADEKGKRIIVFENIDGISNPNEIDKAIGNNGKVLSIKFQKTQTANSNDNLRQTMYNFGNMAGHVYEISAGSAEPNVTYYLVNSDNFNVDGIIETTSLVNTEVDEKTIERIKKIKNRPVKTSWLLSKVDNKTQLCVVIFEKQNDDMLASIAFVAPEKIVFKDYPAKYDPASTWVVDDNGEITPEMIKTLFLAQSNQGLLLGITFVGFEGENTDIYIERGNIFEETNIGSGRYTAPI